MQNVCHDALEKIFEDIGLVHGGVAMGTRDTKLDVEEGTDHGCLGEGDCIFDGWLAVGATLYSVGETDGQEGEEKMVDWENFHRQC